jgi:hypothetical protein
MQESKGDDNYDIIVDNFQQLRPDRNMAERSFNREDIREIHQSYSQEENKRRKMSLSPLEMFQTSLYTVYSELNRDFDNKVKSNGIFMVDKIDDFGELFQYSEILDNPQFKNALAYIMGYLVVKNLNNDNTINKQYLLNLVKFWNIREGKKKKNDTKDNSIFSQYGVEIPDIIRYARLWMNLKQIVY